MAATSGQDVVDSLGRRDLNQDGSVINLAIVGSSRFYDFEVFEKAIDQWVNDNGYPDLVIVGGQVVWITWQKDGLTITQSKLLYLQKNGMTPEGHYTIQEGPKQGIR